MHIALIGSGNTAAATLMQLAAADRDIDITLVGRNEDRLMAALLDAASAYPRSARRMKVAGKQALRDADVIAVCVGAQMALGDTPKSLFARNAEIARNFLDGGIARRARLVVIGTPVDDLTALFVASGKFDKERVIGFGGDLDTARLHYVMGKDFMLDEAVALGEHGSRTIPVYAGEAEYADTAVRVRTLLKSITAKAGAPRNLATGVWLSRLVLALCGDAGEAHVVCGHVPDYDLCLTWPRKVTAAGLGAVMPVAFGQQARAELDMLLDQKRQELAAIEQLAATLF